MFNIFLENRAVYEIRWKNDVQPDRLYIIFVILSLCFILFYVVISILFLLILWLKRAII
jgi:hypothetical protein